MDKVSGTATQELRSVLRQLRSETCTRGVSSCQRPTEREQAVAVQRQLVALKASTAPAFSSSSSRGYLVPQVLPDVSAHRPGTRVPICTEASIGQKGEGEGAGGGSGGAQFMSGSDLSRMRHEMREQCRARSRDQARRRADIDQDCPVFLSLRMRRMLEFVLAQPPSDLDGVALTGKDYASLGDDMAKALARLIFHNSVPPAFVRHALQEMAKEPKPAGGSADAVYQEVFRWLSDNLREDPPSGVDWSSAADRMLVPATVDTQAAEKTPHGAAWLNNEDVVVQRKAEDRGPPKAWFGEDDVEADRYVFKRVVNKTLPIQQYKEDIVKMVRDNQIVLIQGETGCGKTTQVPQYILEAALKTKSEQRRAVRIIVTQPRRIAAITVAKRVAEELGEKVGEGIVGYKIRGTTVAGPRCKLLFCTTGVVLRRLANEGSKWMFSPKTVTHLLVDEVHERGVDTDFMLTFLKEVQPKRPNLRVVLMSATMDTECFLKYFSLPTTIVRDGGSEEVAMSRPPMVICPAFCHPVAEVYLEGINARLGRTGPADAKSPDELRRDPNDPSESDGIDYDLILQTIEELERSPDGAWTFATAAARQRPKDPHNGAILIFLPGLGEISQLMTKLQDESEFATRWWVLPLHANLPPEEQQTCFQTDLPPGCTRKIICSTNVAETSVTVPDVTCVIDTCRERRTQVDRYSNTPMLREQWCALDSLKQRRGRAGRVQPGVCFRVLPQKYMERLEAVTPPEMQRVPLENVYLQVCASGIADRPGFLAKTPDPPDSGAVQFAEMALQDLGALDEREHDGLTPLGRHLAALPCHPRLGKILVLGCLLGVPGPCMSICGAMSVRSPLLTTQDQNKRQAWQAARMELVESIGCRSDHCVWAYIMQEWKFGDIKQRDLCRQLGMSFERMCSSMFERKHLCEALVMVGLLPNRFLWNEWFDQDKMPDWALVRAAVVGGLYPNIMRVERSTPRFQSSNQADKGKWMRYSILQRHYTRQEGMSYPKSLNLHPNSLCFGQDQYHYPWLAFYTIQHTTKLYAYDVSEVSPFALMLFGEQPVFNDHTKEVEIGGWARFICPDGSRLLPLVLAARTAIQKALERKLGDVRHDLGSSKALQVCAQLLKSNGLGYRRPSPPPPRRNKKKRAEDALDEWEDETRYLECKDREHEEKNTNVWAAAKRQVETSQAW